MHAAPSRITSSTSEPKGIRVPITYGHLHLGVAQHLRDVIAELGLDADALIQEARLDPRVFSLPDNAISSAALGRLLALATERSGCAHIGLLVGQKAGLGDLGVVGDIMRNASNLRVALRDLVSHLQVQNRAAVARLQEEDGVASLSYNLYDPHADGAAAHVEAAIATAVSAIRELVGSEWAPSEILLPRSAPSSLAPYWRFFRAPVRFDSEVAAVLFPTEELSLSRGGADPKARRQAEEAVHLIERNHPILFTERLRRLLRTELLSHACHAEDIARQLSIHRRTLHRWLRQEGTCYTELVNEVKFTIAKQLLENTRMDVTEIATVLDFSELAAFTRAFRRWAKMTPTAWRAHIAKPMHPQRAMVSRIHDMP